MRLSKSRFGRAIEGQSVVAGGRHVAPSAPPSKRAAKMIITALIATLGIGAGWVGGKMLNARISRAAAVAPPSDAPIAEKPSPTSQPSESQLSESPQPAKRNSAAENSPDPLPESTAEAAVEKPAATPESSTKEAASKESPPKVPRVDKEEETDTTAAEDPSKEIGRKALKKMSKEIQKSKRDPANKNKN